ncbi:MAG: flagellar protein FlaG [Desulfobacterales bacterium]|nr:flagellar protein FlaG [Desulfobacterales bacterium]
MLVESAKNATSGVMSPAQARLPVGTGMSPKGEAATKPVHEPSTADLKEVAANVQENLKFMSDVDLQFSVHEASGQVMIQVREESTGKLIREIPSKEVLNIAAKFDEMVGLIMDKKG